jgi:rRNA maturation endonuclease Nob1
MDAVSRDDYDEELDEGRDNEPDPTGFCKNCGRVLDKGERDFCSPCQSRPVVRSYHDATTRRP